MSHIHIGVHCAQIQSPMRLKSISRKITAMPHNTHVFTGCTRTHTRFKGQGHFLTNCLHHAQLGCERMHFWQEGAGWQDPGRDRSACSPSAAPFADAVLGSDSVSPPHRTSRRMRTAGESTMVCKEDRHMRESSGRAWLVVALLNSAPHLSSEFHIPYGFSSFFKMVG